MTWLTNWTRRKSKVVNNPITDYQMKLIIHKSGTGPDTSTDVYLNSHCRDDFADLRFTGPDQTTILNYWIESIVSGVATVWIKIPTLTPTNNIYIYYDYLTNTTSLSNGDNTFLFFDDFNGPSLDTNKWYVVNSGGTGSVTVANGYADIYHGAQANNEQLTGKTSFGANVAYECCTKHIMSYWNWPLMAGINNAYPGNDILSILECPSNWPKTQMGAKSGGAGSYVNNTTLNSVGVTGLWYKYKIERLTASANYYRDDVFGGNLSSNIPSIALPIKFVTDTSNSASSEMYIDWAFVHKYIPPEPTFGVSSTEELNITAIDMILNTSSCLGPCSITATVTWQNLGTSNITFRPAIFVDSTIVSATIDITIAPNGGTGSSSITTDTLPVGTHTICPYPN